MFFRYLFIFLFLLPIKVFALIEVDITRGNLNPLPVAVSPLAIDKASKDNFKRILNKEPVMVHCLAGLGRTGTILACYLIKYEKMSAEDAIQHIREKRHGSIQSFVQEELIFQYAKTLND